MYVKIKYYRLKLNIALNAIENINYHMNIKLGV